MTPGLVTLLHLVNLEEIIIKKKKKQQKRHQVFQRKSCKWLELLLCVCREVPRNNCCGFWNDLFPRDCLEEDVKHSAHCIREQWQGKGTDWAVGAAFPKGSLLAHSSLCVNLSSCALKKC